ncbi:hypothetical protein WJX84_001303 [Apatococcus fuscideae]|uniref:SnoaL-like domain-containing protein n=1 Tax=Apatococcus fuscideae TaxID=2026836 RepID=A0AAW1TGK5_9CHLO
MIMQRCLCAPSAPATIRPYPPLVPGQHAWSRRSNRQVQYHPCGAFTMGSRLAGSRPGSRLEAATSSYAPAAAESWQYELYGAALVERYYAAVNARDLGALMQLFAPDCTHDGLAYQEPFTGWQAVRTFYQDLFASLPEDVRFVQDDASDGGICTASVTWHLMDAGGATPFGKGLTFFRWDQAGKITYLRDSPEHIAKLSAAALPGLRIAIPFLRSLAPFLPISAPASSGPRATTTPTSSNAPGQSNASGRISRSIDGASSSGSAAAAAGPWIGNLSGTWVKDMEASNSETYGQALDVMRLNGLQRTTALRLIEGVEIFQDTQGLSVEFLTVVPFFRVKEAFKFRRQTSMGRRDLRPGSQFAQLSEIPEGLRAAIHWGAPLPGDVQEDFICPDKDTLHVVSCVKVAGKSATTTQVYRREATWTPKNKMSPGAFGLSSFPWNPWAGNSY